MTSMKNLVSLVAVLAFALFSIANVSAFATITDVQVNGVHALSAGTTMATFAGDTIPVFVVFTADTNASDVRVKAWLSGESAYSVSSDRFDVIAGNTYSKLMAVQAPSKIDPQESFHLEVSIESRSDGVSAEASVNLMAERPSYAVQLLDVNMDSKVTAGDSLGLDIVLKNVGRQLAEDTFVTVTIPALGVQQRAYFGDLSSVDQSNPDKEDAVERRMTVSIPSDAPAGVYAVQVEASNSDSDTVASRKVAIVGASDNTAVIPGSTTSSFAVGEEGKYSITVINAGNKIGIYELGFETVSGLTLTADEPVFAVPAGSSKTVTFEASATKAGSYNFAAVVSSNGNVVQRETYSAAVEGSSFAGNATLLVTIVLAIVFVVLLVVLIVLLTKKPQKSEEFGESYY
jgi:uncharacterized membrane protein